MSALERLLAAADGGDLSAARAALDGGVDPDSVPEGSWGVFPALHVAAAKGHEAVVRLLLDRGAAVDNLLEKNGYTALRYAASFGREAVARLLLEHGAEVDRTGYRGLTPLVAAMLMFNNHDPEPVARLLLEHGADIEAAVRHDEVFVTLARKGSEAVVRLLVEHGADVNAAGVYGSMPLSKAARSGNVAVVRLLLELGANVHGTNTRGDTALMAAAAYPCNEAVVRLLLEHGADVNADDMNEDNAFGGSPLSRAARGGHESNVRLLAESGARLDQAGLRGITALMHASQQGKESTVRLLAELGANVDAVDEDGKTAIEHAGRYRRRPEQERMARVLLSYGATVDEDGEWRALFRDVPLVRDCRAAVEEAVRAAGDRDVARLCGDYVSVVDRWKPKRERRE